ncbi:MAG: YihY/virulence factor BrkB family protein [Candidatus Korobacteraceae bacterium]|jgi:membrane protein
MLSFLQLLRTSFVKAFEHDQFAVAKAAAYSAIFTLFPAALLLASALVASQSTEAFIREISYAIGRIMPPGTRSVVLAYFVGAKPRPIGMLVTTSVITLWTASGVMISWMDGFHKAYGIPRKITIVKERLTAFLLVFLAGVPMAFASFLVAFGNQIERWIMYHAGHDFSAYILGISTALRWIIATLTSIAVIALVYHHGVPRTQPWHRVLPGAILATVMWFLATVLFGTYLRHFSNYTVIYGSVGTAIALLIWLYLVSFVVLIGAEFNAQRHPRYLFGAHSELKPPNVTSERV